MSAEETNLMGCGEDGTDAEVNLGDVPQKMEDDLHNLSSIFNPNFCRLDKAAWVGHLQSLHWYLTLLWGAAAIAFWISLGVVPSLGVDRSLPVTVSVVSPPVNSTSNGSLMDTFHTESIYVSGLPLTVLLATAATWHFLYHVLHSIIYKGWVKIYVESQVNPYRWVFTAGTKTLSFIVLFALNGEHEITSFLFLSATIAGICFLAHALDEAVAWAYKATPTSKKESNYLFGLSNNVINYGRALSLLSIIVIVNFIIRLAKNRSETPRWVRILSIAMLIYEALTVTYYVYSTYQTRCNKNVRAQFVTGDWRFMQGTFVSFAALSATVFAKMAST